jgi:hypothetical protein
MAFYYFTNRVRVYTSLFHLAFVVLSCIMAIVYQWYIAFAGVPGVLYFVLSRLNKTYTYSHSGWAVYKRQGGENE